MFQALRKVAGKALIGTQGWTLAILSFFGLFLLGVPFPLIILAAGLWGILMPGPTDPGTTDAAPRDADTFRTLLIWSTLWAAPLALLWALDQAFLVQLGLFFSKLAVVTFGGAYAVLAYMTQTVVQDYGWITTEQMIDALGLAETTPGPLILVTEFVALLAGYAQGGLSAAVAAGLLALWVTFTPCFLWIFLAGPYLERIAAQPRLSKRPAGDHGGGGRCHCEPCRLVCAACVVCVSLARRSFGHAPARLANLPAGGGPAHGHCRAADAPPGVGNPAHHGGDGRSCPAAFRFLIPHPPFVPTQKSYGSSSRA